MVLKPQKQQQQQHAPTVSKEFEFVAVYVRAEKSKRLRCVDSCVLTPITPLLMVTHEHSLSSSQSAVVLANSYH